MSEEENEYTTTVTEDTESVSTTESVTTESADTPKPKKESDSPKVGDRVKVRNTVKDYKKQLGTIVSELKSDSNKVAVRMERVSFTRDIVFDLKELEVINW